MGVAAMQYKIGNDSTGATSYRPLARTFQNFEGAVTLSSNLKLTYGGEWAILMAIDKQPPNPATRVFALKVPPVPVDDGIDRSTFVPAMVSVTPPSGQNIASARIKFGYAEQGSPGSYFCTSRREACVAVSATIDPLNPFRFSETDSYNPMPCAAGCTISIPVYPLHTSYYSVEFLNPAGVAVAATNGIAVENVVVGASPVGNLATQTISFTPPAQVTLPLVLTATASSGLPVSFTSTTNNICTVSGSTLTPVAAGNCSITATQPGNAVYGPATAVSRSISIISAPGSGSGNTLAVSPTAVTITALPTAGPSRQAVTLSFQTSSLSVPTYSIATTTNQGAWLSTSPVTGTMTKSLSKKNTYTALIEISGDPTGMSAGFSYQGNVTFSVGGATASTQVTMYVQPK
jgi:hypothetical protein